MHEGILRRQSVREPAARTYARALPIVPVRARGLTIEGADGRRYLDCLSGAGALALGHNHPVVLEAIRKVLDSGAPLHALDLATPVKDAFVTELFRTLPPGLADRARVRFCGPAGTDAVKAAEQLVQSATGRSGMLAFTGVPDGATTEAPPMPRDPTHPSSAGLPQAQDYRCPFGIGSARGAELAARWTESVLDPVSGLALPAGMLLEPVRSEDGVITPPDAWMRRMRQLTADRSVPLIADEIQTGVGRTGAFWAVDHSGVTPDVMVLSNAIGGSLPLAVLVYRDDLDAGEPHTPTAAFPGNQLAMAAGTATLSYVRENSLGERAGAIGSRMLDQLRSLAREFPILGDIRGRGLLIGIELVDPAGDAEVGLTEAQAQAQVEAEVGADGRHRVVTADRPAEGAGARSGLDVSGHDGGAFMGGPRPAAPELAAAVQRECLRRGLIVDLGGRRTSVIRLLPPLTITDGQATAVLDRLADAVANVARNYAASGSRPHRQDQQHPPHDQAG
ncbi:2,4-diaminobutyrate 4-aminotransferase [Streptomyces resistomycificus]|uniref:Diaminobutyrate--2-oxoglutarate transaminase n=1 Tax=Streptomyces resistomycificus TaxID=67356 RepID=A0A0L8LI24_9ACTN|nr:2,4-diaminobutyrate 4-aminotransferase [Streptomyces resistomycificus]KUN90888.1 2,4-diaminobutyrate 4-aminotransferase [Streptomyces resistomycificus]